MGWREWLRSKAARPAGAAPDGPASKQLEVVASAVRSAILQAVAERCPAGWRCLVLSPPPTPTR